MNDQTTHDQAGWLYKLIADESAAEHPESTSAQRAVSIGKLLAVLGEVAEPDALAAAIECHERRANDE